ncbi:polyphenol oxidase family protein [Quadrisphaera sp. DSM 44207]|uniref:polyphenol oxidase family protein n=1 Tax=Quadrisphaera sp. DSM 44207 TaxID=1881057 RepID=UPI00088FCA52|nr:polyphenol oxidase family protein [Quadrisphaera sp. DSM 44207]SDQ53440.1 conserved hypothetical protein [Quadrisphaera sp. DSM 44207]
MVLTTRRQLDGACGRALVALTGRWGGASSGGRLNLGDHVGDDPAAVAANRARVAAALDLPASRVLYARQVHGAAVAVADGPWPGPPPEADAVVTDRPGLALGVLVADCVPVLLADADAGVVGVAHAGRRGMDAGVVAAAVRAVRDLGGRAPRALLGPSICARCYGVPAQLRDEVAARSPVAASVTWRGEPSLDVAAGVLAQLAALGVPAEQLPGCTAESPDLSSARRDGAGAARTAGLVRWEPRA